MRAVILAGGRGVRLRPLTYTVPKPLLPVGERPILEEIIIRLKRHGITDVVVAVGYRAELIETYFRDGAQLGVRISYVREAQPLGTAGPLALVRDELAPGDDAPLFVMNGDILTDLDPSDLAAFHARGAYALTVVTRQYQLTHPYGVITVEGGRVTGIVEKPAVTDTVSAGVYMVERRALGHVPSGQYCDMPDLVNRLVAAGETVGAYPFEGEWIAIDRIEQLEDAARTLAQRQD
jgi:NDP-sugar pyrophosphorylase family protein